MLSGVVGEIVGVRMDTSVGDVLGNGDSDLVGVFDGMWVGGL